MAVHAPSSHARQVLGDDDLGGELEEDIDDGLSLLLRESLGLQCDAIRHDQTVEVVHDGLPDLVRVAIQLTPLLHGLEDLDDQVELGVVEPLGLGLGRCGRTLVGAIDGREPIGDLGFAEVLATLATGLALLAGRLGCSMLFTGVSRRHVLAASRVVAGGLLLGAGHLTTLSLLSGCVIA